MCSMVISKVSTFIKKYFLEGQKLEEKQKQALEALPSDAPFTTRILVKHRRLIGKPGKMAQMSSIIQQTYFRNSDTTCVLWNSLVDAGFQTWLFLLLPWQIPPIHYHDLWGVHRGDDQWRRRSRCLPSHDFGSWNQTCRGQRLFIDDSILWYLLLFNIIFTFSSALNENNLSLRRN